MTEADIGLCVKAGADAVGFVTEYPVSVPWNIDRARARELVALVPPFVTTAAVVGGSVESILQIADTVRPDLLQLHGDETVEDILTICSSLADRGIKVIKALRIDADTGKALFSINDPIKAAHLMIAHIDKKRKVLGIDKSRDRVLYDMAMRRDLEK